jgi:hypothetical protein
MFPLLNNNPASHLVILLPDYDPLIQYHARGSGAPASGRTQLHSDRDVRRDRADSGMAQCCRSDQQPASCGAGSRGDRMAGGLGEARAPRPRDLTAAGAPGGSSLWTRWMLLWRRESRSGRVRDDHDGLNTSDGPRLENGAPRDDVRSMERGKHS